MQSNLDANHFRILNLDTSNLIFDEIPTQSAPAHKWFRSYDNGTHTFGSAQPLFTDVGGNLTLTQQSAITRLGQIAQGAWRATALQADKVPNLSSIRNPTGPVDFAHQRATDLADPLEDQDAVTLRMFNAIMSGLRPKAAVRLASTENMTLATLNREVDGEAIFDNDRILVKNQNQTQQNGIYLCHPGAWTRAVDSDECDDMDRASTFVLEGDTQAGSTWFQTSDLPVNCIIGTAHWVWQLLTRSTTTEAGAGLGRSGHTLFAIGTPNRISVGSGIDIDINYEGQDSIGVVGTIEQGTWEGDIISGEFGGTGFNNGDKQIALSGNFSTQIGAGAGPDAFPTSFLVCTLMGSTNVVFPLVGTLATVAGEETFHNKHISADQVDSGVLLISNGGTSANTALAALFNLLPDVTGHAGQSLHTDGADIFYWA